MADVFTDHQGTESRPAPKHRMASSQYGEILAGGRGALHWHCTLRTWPTPTRLGSIPRAWRLAPFAALVTS